MAPSTGRRKDQDHPAIAGPSRPLSAAATAPRPATPAAPAPIDAACANTRPVAAKDYWDRPGIRGAIARDELNVVMVDRARDDPDADPLQTLREALEHGFSLIIFPEGTRSAQPFPNPFKSGLYHLAMEFPNVELIPVYIENLHRSMPKGALIPVPAICTVRFGAPLERIDGEDKAVFLERARAAVIALEAD